MIDYLSSYYHAHTIMTVIDCYAFKFHHKHKWLKLISMNINFFYLGKIFPFPLLTNEEKQQEINENEKLKLPITSSSLLSLPFSLQLRQHI